MTDSFDGPDDWEMQEPSAYDELWDAEPAPGPLPDETFEAITGEKRNGLRVVTDQDADEAEETRLVDLAPFVNGTFKPVKPDVGAFREDGVQMLYPGRWHTVIGPTEAGKSWLGLVHAVACMQAGLHVFYCHFEESLAKGTVDRLLQMGVDPELILEFFHWFDCSQSWAPGEFAIKLKHSGYQPHLVILDGINAACGWHGWDVERTGDVQKYRREFVSPATRVGAAVLSLGHPVKSEERAKERHGFGSTAWLDLVDGVGFRFKAGGKPIDRKKVGYANIYVVKDRYGEVSRNAAYNPKNPDGWRSLATLKVNDTGEQTIAMVTKPYQEPTPEPAEDEVAQRVLSALVNQPGGRVASMEKLKALLNPTPHGRKTQEAVNTLEAAGKVRITDGPKNSKVIELVLEGSGTTGRPAEEQELF